MAVPLMREEVKVLRLLYFTTVIDRVTKLTFHPYCSLGLSKCKTELHNPDQMINGSMKTVLH